MGVKPEMEEKVYYLLLWSYFAVTFNQEVTTRKHNFNSLNSTPFVLTPN